MMKNKMQKRMVYAMLSLALTMATGCGNENAEETVAGNAEEIVAENAENITEENILEDVEKEGLADAEGTEESRSEDCPEMPDAMIPAVMADDRLYFDTGYNSCMMRCGVLDGNITSSVSGTQLPEKNGEANFDGAEGFQYGADEGTIEVYMNNEWRVFATEEVRTTDYIPSGVPHFKAVVKECYADGTALVVMEENVNDSAWMLEEEGEYIIPLDNLVYSESAKEGASAENSIFKAETRIEIWFNGALEETNPGRLGRVYRIESIDTGI